MSEDSDRLDKRKEYDALKAIDEMKAAMAPPMANNPVTMHTDNNSAWGAAEEEEQRKKRMKKLMGG